MTTLNATIARIFDAAALRAEDFATALAAQGITSREQAEPLAMQWASKRYKIALVEGQRGITFDKEHDAYEAAQKAKTRVLSRCFPKVAPAKSNHTDEVALAAARLQKRFDARELKRLIKLLGI